MNREMDTPLGEFCPRYHNAVELIGRRWSGVIVRALLGRERRFSELTAMIPGLSDRLLSGRLKELEAEGVVERVVIPQTPVRVEYRLTEKGRDLAPVVEAVAEWAERWLPAPETPSDEPTSRRRSARGTPRA